MMFPKKEYIRIGRLWHVPSKNYIGGMCQQTYPLRWGKLSAVTHAECLPHPACVQCVKFERHGFPVKVIQIYALVDE